MQVLEPEFTQKGFLNRLIMLMDKEFHIRGTCVGDLSYVIEEFAARHVPKEDLPKFVFELMVTALRLEKL